MAASAISKIRKIAISRPRFERFLQNLAWLRSSTLLTLPNVKNFKFWKSTMAAAAIFKKSKNHYISSQFKRFRRNLAHWCTSTFLTFSKIWNFKNPTWRRPPSWKIAKSPYLGRGWSDFDKIWHSDAVPPSWPFWRLKIEILKSKLKFGMRIDMHRSFNIDEHLTEQHWQPLFLFSKPSVSIHVCCSYIELSWSTLHKTGDLQVGNWHVNCQHSGFFKKALLANYR